MTFYCCLQAVCNSSVHAYFWVIVCQHDLTILSIIQLFHIILIMLYGCENNSSVHYIYIIVYDGNRWAIHMILNHK